MGERDKTIQALSAIAAVFVLIALFSPLWSINVVGKVIQVRELSYHYILTNIQDFTSGFGGGYGYNTEAMVKVATGVLLIVVSTFCVLLTLILSLVSAVSKKGVGVAAAFAWVTLITAYIGTYEIANATEFMKIIGAVVNIQMGSAVIFVIISAILLTVAWILKR